MTEELKKMFADANRQAEEINAKTKRLVADMDAKCEAIKNIKIDTSGIKKAMKIK